MRHCGKPRRTPTLSTVLKQSWDVGTRLAQVKWTAAFSARGGKQAEEAVLLANASIFVSSGCRRTNHMLSGFENCPLAVLRPDRGSQVLAGPPPLSPVGEGPSCLFQPPWAQTALVHAARFQFPPPPSRGLAPGLLTWPCLHLCACARISSFCKDSTVLSD